jgi:hypothetical protein
MSRSAGTILVRCAKLVRLWAVLVLPGCNPSGQPGPPLPAAAGDSISVFGEVHRMDQVMIPIPWWQSATDGGGFVIRTRTELEDVCRAHAVALADAPRVDFETQTLLIVETGPGDLTEAWTLTSVEWEGDVVVATCRRQRLPPIDAPVRNALCAIRIPRVDADVEFSYDRSIDR